MLTDILTIINIDRDRGWVDRVSSLTIEARSNINLVGAGLCDRFKPEINLIQTCPTPPET